METRSGTARPFLELLDEQYALVEKYANAQTLLYNTTSATSATTKARGEFDDPETPILRALETLETAKWDLRSNFESLDSNSRGSSNNTLRSDHVELSKRVISTIAINPSWHANGLCNDTGRISSESFLKANTVAIAALNASIARLKDIEGNSI